MVTGAVMVTVVAPWSVSRMMVTGTRWALSALAPPRVTPASPGCTPEWLGTLTGWATQSLPMAGGDRTWWRAAYLYCLFMLESVMKLHEAGQTKQHHSYSKHDPSDRLAALFSPQASWSHSEPGELQLSPLAYFSEECLGTGQASMEILFITSHATQSIIPYLTWSLSNQRAKNNYCCSSSTNQITKNFSKDKWSQTSHSYLRAIIHFTQR